MKNIICLCAFLLSAFAGIAQIVPDYYNQTRMVTQNENGRVSVRAYVQVFDNGPEKLNQNSYFWFQRDSIYETQNGFSGHLLEGDFQAYHPNGNLKEQGQFACGQKIGKWRTWHANGIVESTFSFKKGAQSGLLTEFDDQGLVVKKSKFRKGTLKGKVKEFVEGKRVKEEKEKMSPEKKTKEKTPKMKKAGKPAKKKEPRTKKNKTQKS